jgi:hypothetical protein
VDRDDDGILWDVVEEHLDEAEFLWSAWERGLTAPNLTLTTWRAAPRRGCRRTSTGWWCAAPAVLERLLAPALHDYQRDRAAAAAWAWLAAEGDRAVPAAVRAPAAADPPECQGIARALGLHDGEVLGGVDAAAARGVGGGPGGGADGVRGAGALARGVCSRSSSSSGFAGRRIAT